MKRKRSGLASIALAAGLAVSSSAMAQYDIVSNRPGTFTDISGTGTPLGGGDDVNYTFTSTVGNALFPAGQCAVTTNGHLSSNSANGGTAYVNGPIGVSGVPGGIIGGSMGHLLPWWDDLMTDGGDLTSQIYWQEIGGVLIVQWNRTSHYFAVPGEIISFQVKVFSNVASGTYAQYLYQDTAFGGSHALNDFGASATIGYVGDANAGAGNIQYSYNTANAVADGTVLSVIPGVFGACCLVNGTCVLRGAAACAAQGGTYRGDGSVCATANCPQPCPPLVTGPIGGPSTGWPSTHGSQNTRLFRDGVPDTCLSSAAGGAPIAGSFAYDKYDFENSSGSATCVTVDINTPCTGAQYIYAGAYIGAYDPSNPTLNNVASCGASPDPTAGMSFTVPANTAFSVVFSEVTPGAGCSGYDFFLHGAGVGCPVTGACCLADGSCSLLTSATCANSAGIFRGNNTACATANCPQPPSGACCYTNGTCVVRTTTACASSGGTYRGDGTACGAVVCPVTELVTNGGFETGDFTGWTQWGNTGFTGVDAGLPHSGQFSAYFGPIGSHGGIEQVIPMQAGQLATLQFWYICDPFTPNYFAAWFEGEQLVEIVDDLTNTQWTLFTFQVAAGTANPVLQFETQHDPAYITLDDITMSLVGGPTCYPNCDGSTTAPCLNVADFGCFLNRFGAGDTYANCDGSTTPPVLNVADFGCFLNAFGAGCSGC